MGLAYSVGGGIGARFDHPGILQLAMGTKSGSTVEAIQALYGQIDELKTKPVADAEIARAKDTILNAFVFNFDTPDKVLRERMAYEFYGYPADFLERYRSGIEKVTTADVARIIPKYLHKDQLAVLVVGNTAEFDKPLSSLGAVSDVDITIPPPPGEKREERSAAEKKESNPEGKALAEKVAKALGGEDKLKTVKSLRSNFSLQQPNGTIQIENTIVFPDRMKADLQTPQGNFTMVVSPEASFAAAAGMGVQDMPASRKTDMLAQLHRDLIYVAQHVDDPAFSFSESGTEKAGTSELAILDVSGPGVDVRWFVEPRTGKVARLSYKAMGQSGPVDSETVLSDWKTVEGLNLPFHRENKQGGQDSSSVQFSKIEINPNVDQKIFAKPAATPAQ
jgi:zinc protease